MEPLGRLCAAQRDTVDPKGSAASLRCRARLGPGPEKGRLKFLSSVALALPKWLLLAAILTLVAVLPICLAPQIATALPDAVMGVATVR